MQDTGIEVHDYVAPESVMCVGTTSSFKFCLCVVVFCVFFFPDVFSWITKTKTIWNRISM